MINNLKKSFLRPEFFLSILVFLYVVFFTLICFLKFNSFAYGDYDLSLFNQIIWNILHGSLFSSILGIVYFGNHVQLIWFLIAPIYWLFPHPFTLLFLQSLALGAAAYPLYFLTKKILGPRWGVLVAAIYLIYPAAGYINLFEFHPSAFLPFFIFSAIYFFYRDRFKPFLFFLLLVIFVQENMALVALSMGAYAFIRKKPLVWVLVPLVTGVLYLLVCLKIVVPHFSEDTSQFVGLYRHLGETPVQAVINFFKDPLPVFKFIFSEPRQKYFVGLFGPLSFVPFMSALPLFVAAPLFAQHLLSSREGQVAIYAQYTAELIPFIFLSFVLGIKFLLRFGFIYKNRQILARVLFLVAIVSCHHFGPHFSLPRWAVTMYRKDVYDLQKERFLEKVPEDASIVATFEFLPRLVYRHELYSFHHHFMGSYTLSEKPYSLPQTVSYALLDFGDDLTFRSFYKSDSYKNIQELFSRGQWGVVDVRDSVVLFAKGAKNNYFLYQILSEEPHPSRTFSAVLAEGVAFLGFDVNPGPDSSLNFVFYWKSLKEIDKDINVFIDFVDEKGVVRAQVRHPVCYRIYPTQAWKAGEWVKENLYLTIPPALTPGRYVIKMGFYDFATRREFYVSPDDPWDRITLTGVVIK